MFMCHVEAAMHFVFWTLFIISRVISAKFPGKYIYFFQSLPVNQPGLEYIDFKGGL